ncbi:hypothetical protein D2Q93_07410 [Alicyclobacillaceae bacterium I2511]|nr:hypothetical protein D2Q93_07410 [Alicyclobacillaceae bacterium I2511]
MSQRAKFTYFLAALVAMISLAAASTEMAVGRNGLAVVLFILAFVIIGVAFMVKRRVMKK